METEQQRVRARFWCVTINNYNRADIGQFDIIQKDCDYWIFGKEVAPETGTKHLQCYIVFKNPKTAKFCHGIFPSRGHWTKANGTPEHNRTYCSKGTLLAVMNS